MSFLFRIEATIAKLQLPPGGNKLIEFDVSNVTATSPKGRFAIEPSDPRMHAWFRAVGASEVISFRGSETKRLRFDLTLPADVAAGAYSFKLRGGPADAPDLDVSESQSAVLEVAAKAPAVVAPAPAPPLSPSVSKLEVVYLGAFAIWLGHLLWLCCALFVEQSQYRVVWGSVSLAALVVAVFALRHFAKAMRPGCTVEQLWGRWHKTKRVISIAVLCYGAWLTVEVFR